MLNDKQCAEPPLQQLAGSVTGCSWAAVEFCHVAIATGLKAQHQSMLRRLLGTDRS